MLGKHFLVLNYCVFENESFRGVPTHRISLRRTKPLRLSALHVFRASRIQEAPSADDVADEARAADFSDPLAVAQDVEDPVEALIHFQLGELLDVGLHDKKLAWKTAKKAT